MKRATPKRASVKRTASSVRVGSGRSKKTASRFAFNKRLALSTFVVVFGGLGILTILATHADPIGNLQRFRPWGSGVIAPYQLTNYTVDPSGNMWFASGPNARIGEYPTGSTGASQPLWINMPSGYGVSGVTSDHAGNIWFISKLNTLGEIPAGSHTPVFYPLGGSNIAVAGVSHATPRPLVIDPEGNIWFLMYGNPSVDLVTVNKIGELPTGTPPSRAASALRTTNFSGNYNYTGLVADPSGNIWVNEWRGSSGSANANYGLAKIAAGTTQLPQSHDLPVQYHFPTNSLLVAQDFTADNAGNIWLALTQQGTGGHTNYIGEWPVGSSPSTAIKLMSLPHNLTFSYITSDRANNIWLDGALTPNGARIEKLPAGSTRASLVNYTLPQSTLTWEPWFISADAQGNIWFAQPGANEIDEIGSVSTNHPVAGTSTPTISNASQQNGGSPTSNGGSAANNGSGSNNNVGSSGQTGTNATGSSPSSSASKPDKQHAVYAKKHHWYDPLLFWHYL